MMLALIWIFVSLIVGALSTEKTIGFWGGFLASLFFSPIIGIIIALASRSRVAAKMEERLASKMITEDKNHSTQKLLDLKKLKDEGVIEEAEYERLRQKYLTKL